MYRNISVSEPFRKDPPPAQGKYSKEDQKKKMFRRMSSLRAPHSFVKFPDNSDFDVRKVLNEYCRLITNYDYSLFFQTRNCFMVSVTSTEFGGSCALFLISPLPAEAVDNIENNFDKGYSDV